jgi:DNA mismatch repair protein MutS2
MIYPASFEEKIGFDVVRTLTKEYCSSAMAKSLVDDICYSTDYDEVQRKIQETDEFLSVLLYDDAFPIQEYDDLRATLAHLHVEGTFVEVEELARLRDFIASVIHTFVYFRIRHEEENKYPALWEICQNVLLEKELQESINRLIDAKGNLRDDASEELRRIRREIIKISGEADRKIHKLLTLAKQDSLVKEDAEMTIRNGRLCIPVPAPFKRRIKGFIHDESATGQTVFIEPAEVFDANNELRDLQNAEKREIIRIMTAISDKIRPSIPNLLFYHEFVGMLDFIRAKARLAIELKALKPHISSEGHIHWQNAMHPLLYLNFKTAGKKVQPLDIELNQTQRILIISGPNAGGKSVCLKTVGLLQYMLQCGFLVTMKDTSEMGIFEDFFIDMGDEQSIDNDLSTYSSHLTNLKTMVECLGPRSLFLIDEFGSGTEPNLGGAMAEAILEALYHKKSFGIITTHYGNLKLFPDRFPEAFNGAMLFDTQNLKPLFMLKMGKPGSSFTYEIARHIGLPEEIIQSAIEKSGTAQIDYERKLEEVEMEKLQIDKTLKMAQAADDQLATLIQEYSDKYHELEKYRKEIIQTAKNQATAILDGANKMIEKTIREIKESKADAEKTKQVRKEVADMKASLHSKVEENSPLSLPKSMVPRKKKVAEPQPLVDRPLKAGDAVLILSVGAAGEVLSVQGEDVVVSFNSISLKTTTDKVERISKKEAKAVQSGRTRLDGSSLSETLNKKIAHFKSSVDVRGMRTDEALAMLEPYIDEAVLLNVRQVKILHGKGTGILRKMIRQFLKNRPEVAQFYDEALEMGGDGITVVELR